MIAAATASTEGAIRFGFRLEPARAGDALDAERFARLAAWRRILRQLKLIGRDRRRYDGLAYGNLSVRDAAQPARFHVTASQTGGAARLLHRDVVRVDGWDAVRFEVDATGARAPSSESVTHGMIYAADAGVAWIMHVHSGAIWHAAARLGLPSTPADVPYGSPAMATAVAALARCHRSRPLVFATLGHADGVFACGSDADATGGALVRALADALAGSRA